jgi:predicted dehydrogenase
LTGRIRWGILSTANIALKRFIPGVRASNNGDVLAIASRSEARAREVAAELSIPRAYGSYEALLADPEIDAVYIGLPNSMHAEWTIAAARAGKPVLCEKPLAVDATQAQAMLDECRTLGVPLMEAFMYRFHPQHARVRELLASGAIGELRAFRAAFTFSLEPFNSRNVRLQPALAGGALMDVGCYAVNAARWTFREEPQWASAQRDFRADFGLEIALAGILGFSDGRMATFDCGFRGTGQGWYMLVGSKGTIEAPNAFVPGPVTMDTTLVIVDAAGRREERIPGDDQYKLEAEAFGAALLADRAVPLDPHDAVANLRAIDALQRSAKNEGTRETL